MLARCWYLQYYRSDYYSDRAARQQLKIVPQSARRGLIVDRKGRIMAVSTTVKSVWADPSLIQDKREIADKLAGLLNIDSDKLYRELAGRADKKFMHIARQVSDSQADAVRALKIRGVVVENRYKRRYPMGQLAAHVIGFTDIDGVGLEGVEAGFQKNLAGQPGKILLGMDVRRRPIGVQKPGQKPQDGQIVVLSLDAVIQQCVEEELEKVVAKFQAQSAIGIVMDPDNGEILALANWPTFDLNIARQIDSKVRRNRALTDPYEPGSTFKPFTVASAVEGGYVTFEKKIDCLDRPYRGKGFRPIKEYKHYFGEISVAKILIRSSNIGSAKLAQKMGKEYFHDMVEKFGFGSKTGIDLPGEGVGILRKQWTDKQHTLTRVGFGQGIAVTPIQLIRGFSTLVNGGRLIKPRVVRGLIGNNGQVVEDFNMFTMSQLGDKMPARPLDAGQVISPDVSRQLVDKALVGVVARKEGTAHKAHLEGWQVFGKTGTAQIAKKDGPGYQENKYISSFIAGAPAQNPRLCVLVIVHQPNRSLGLGYTGGVVAAPAVREILHQTLTYLGVPKRKE